MSHREIQSAAVVRRWLDLHPAEGPVLLVGPEAGLADWLDRSEVANSSWVRMAFGEVEASPWLPDGPFPTALVCLPKAREALRMVIHAAAARLAPNGVLFLHGHNDEGIKSAGKVLKQVFASVEAVDARKHCRLWRASGLQAETRGALDDWRSEVVSQVRDTRLTWQSWPGLFAHGRLDGATELLLRALPQLEPGTRVLDYACGAGVITQWLLAHQPALEADALDVDALAVHAARLNNPGAGQIWLSDTFDAVPAQRWQHIISNPPLHAAGVSRDHRALWALVEGAPGRLTPAGTLWLVTQRGVPLDAPLRERFARVRVAASNRGFRVWQAERPLRR